MTDVLNVLKRERDLHKVVVECPNPQCRQPWTFVGAQVTKLEDGIVVLGRCENCQTEADVTIASLGGYIWEPPKSLTH